MSLIRRLCMTWLNTELPRSAIGILVESFEADAGGKTGLHHNVPVTTSSTMVTYYRGAVLTLAQHRDRTLAEWIKSNATFPNTMVDRITPSQRLKTSIIWPRITEFRIAGRYFPKGSNSG